MELRYKSPHFSLNINVPVSTNIVYSTGSILQQFDKKISRRTDTDSDTNF